MTDKITIKENVINDKIMNILSEDIDNTNKTEKIINLLKLNTLLIGNIPITNLQHFTDISYVASGGFGLVYKAKHILDLNNYAIKIIPIKLDSNIENGLHKKIKEIRYLSKLNHPNIIKYCNSWIELSNNELQFKSNISDYFDTTTESSIENNKSTDSIIYDNNSLIKIDYNQLEYYKYIFVYLQMEYMEYNLRDWLLNEKIVKLTNDKRHKTQILYNIVKDIINGIEYLHSLPNPIIHCDIKPSNILINYNMGKWNAKIGDFGLVRTIIDTQQNNKKDIGTFLYSSPEAKIGEYITLSSDIYSLGILLYELQLSYKTDMEKYKLINDFKSGKIKTNTILDNMINKDTNLRPSIKIVKETLIN